jgi:hypothetical protein
MKFQDPTEKGETPGYSLPFAKPYLHPKDGWANEHCWRARLPEVRQRNVWSNGILPCLFGNCSERAVLSVLVVGSPALSTLEMQSEDTSATRDSLKKGVLTQGGVCVNS